MKTSDWPAGGPDGIDEHGAVRVDELVQPMQRRDDASAPAARLGIALSGGGYRASLLAIGALMALVDRTLNKRVDIVSSVSGGSITNAVVAQEGDYCTLAPGDLDECATTLVRPMLKNSLIPLKSTLWVVVLSPIVLLPLVFLNDSTGQRLLGVAIGILIAAVQLLLFGRTLRQLLTAQFGLDKTLGDVATHSTIHAFCCTDLVTGMPLTFSSRHSRVRRRASAGKAGDHVADIEEPRWRLAAVVQASAAFPGIPPLRMRLPEGTAARSRWALCADGGIWNNLGTQGIDDEPGLPELSILCVNASALAKPMAPAWCFVPGAATVMSVARCISILNQNTVEPRVEAIERELSQWAHHPPVDGPVSPLNVVADMRPVNDAVGALRDLGVHVGLDHLVADPWWMSLTGDDTPGFIRTKTKLSRVGRDEARLLLLRGYANTWLASLTLQPLDEGELENEQVRAIKARFDSIVGS